MTRLSWLNGHCATKALLPLASSTNGADYDAWNIGVKHRFTPACSGDLRWFDTDKHDLGSRYDGRMIATLTYNF